MGWLKRRNKVKLDLVYDFKSSGVSPAFWLSLSIKNIPSDILTDGLAKVASVKKIPLDVSKDYAGLDAWEVPNSLYAKIYKIMAKDFQKVQDKILREQGISFISWVLMDAYYHKDVIDGFVILTAKYKGEYRLVEG